MSIQKRNELKLTTVDRWNRCLINKYFPYKYGELCIGWHPYCHLTTMPNNINVECAQLEYGMLPISKTFLKTGTLKLWRMFFLS